jgi:ubiquinone/menaquinone biosynthesis C-methylase UbiE
MNRILINKIRFILEEFIPPIIRDSLIFKYIVKYFYRSDKLHENLKENILNYTKKNYLEYYSAMPEINGKTDNSEDCIKDIIKKILPNNIIDVGCGRGYLLERLRKENHKYKLFGTEIYLSRTLEEKKKKYNFNTIKIDILSIDKMKKMYDTVICTHVLEHILDIRAAYKKLKKICKQRLIIIVPKERPYKYTFNGHLHFFPYEWSLINTLRPDTKNFQIRNIKRDFIFIEDIN